MKLYGILLLSLCPALAFATLLLFQSSVATSPPGPTPPNLSHLILWYDLQDSGKVTVVSGKVSVLTDKSGQGNNATQTTSGDRLTYTASLINGHPGMSNNGTAGILMNLTASLSSIANSGANTVAVVASVNSGYSTIFGNVASGPTYNWPVLGSTGNEVLTTWNGGSAFTDTTTHGDTNPHLFVFTSDSTAPGTKGYLDGTMLTLTASGTTMSFSDAIQILGDSQGGAGGNTLNGNFGEALVYNVILSSGDLTSLHTYESSKWGTP